MKYRSTPAKSGDE